MARRVGARSPVPGGALASWQAVAAPEKLKQGTGPTNWLNLYGKVLVCVCVCVTVCVCVRARAWQFVSVCTPLHCPPDPLGTARRIVCPGCERRAATCM